MIVLFIIGLVLTAVIAVVGLMSGDPDGTGGRGRGPGTGTSRTAANAAPTAIDLGEVHRQEGRTPPAGR